MRRTLTRTASLFLAPVGRSVRALRTAAEPKPAPTSAAVAATLDALTALAGALRPDGLEVAPARLALAEALLPLALPDIPALSAALDDVASALAAGLADAALADQARLAATGPGEASLLARAQAVPGAASARAGAVLARVAIRALPALPAAIRLVALGWAPALALLVAELDLAEAPMGDTDVARHRLDAALAELPREFRESQPCLLPVTRLAAEREPWRPDFTTLAGPLSRTANAPPGDATPFRHRIRLTLEEALAAGEARSFAFRAEPALPAADWILLADGEPVFARASAVAGLAIVNFASAVALPSGTALTALPPAGEYFRHYGGVSGEVWPLRAAEGATPPLVITALAEPCFQGFHKPEHLPGAIGRWMGQHGRIRLPASPVPLRATLRGRHRQALIGEGGLLAAIGDEPLDLLFEPLGLPHDEGEWLIHLHLPPTTLPGNGWLRLSLPELPPRSPSEPRDIGLIFLALELAPLPGATSHRFGAAG